MYLHSHGQNVLFYEDFGSASQKQTPAGWALEIYSGSAVLDSFTFKDTLYHFPPSIEAPYALFDAYYGGNAIGTNGNAAGEEVALLSPFIFLNSPNSLELHMDYYLVSLANSTFNVDISNNGSSWTNLWSSSSISAETESIDLSLSSYASLDSIQLRFRWYNNSTGQNQGYVAFDNIEVLERDSNDIAVEGVELPEIVNCSNTDQTLRVQFSNQGLKRALDIPYRVVLTGDINTSWNDTIPSLDPAEVVTRSLGSFNTSGSSQYKVEVNLLWALDSVSSNNSISQNTSTLALPSSPVVQDQTRCGVGTVTFNSSAQSGEITQWLSQQSNAQLLDTGSSFTTPVLSADQRYYVRNVNLIQDIASTYQGPWRYNGNPTGGTYFTVEAKEELLLDSLFQLCAYAAGAVEVLIYTKQGTYSGAEQNSTLWDLHYTDTVASLGWGKYIEMDIEDILMYPSEVRSFYVVVKGAASPTFKQLNLVQDKVDLTLRSNAVNNLEFGTPLTGYSWNGKLAYKNVCGSSVTIADAYIDPLPNNSEFIQMSPFQGQFNNGSSSDPDIVSELDTITYSIIPPDNYNWGDFSSKWFINSIQMRTLNGTPIPSSDTILNATSGSVGTLIYSPSTGWEDSTIIIQASILTIDNGCDTILQRVIYIAPSPQAEFSATDVCLDQLTYFKNTSSISKGQLRYKWYFDDGDSSESENPIHRYETPGIYNVQLIVTSQLGVIDDTSVQVEVFELPEVSFYSINACEGTPVELINQSSSNSSTVSFIWDFGDGNNSTLKDPTHLFADAGEYQVKLIAQANGCSDSFIQPVYQFDVPIADFTTEGQCQYNTVKFISTSSIEGQENLGATWYFGDSSPKSTGTTTGHIYSDTGRMEALMVVESQFGCIDSSRRILNILPTPNADFDLDLACDQTPTSFTNLTSYQGSDNVLYTWYFGMEDSSDLFEPAYLFTQNDIYEIRLNAVSLNSCSSLASKEIQVFRQPVANFEHEGACSGEEVKFFNRSTNLFGTIDFTWVFGDGDSSFSYAPKHVYTVGQTSIYNVKLTARASNGCETQFSRAIQIGPKPKCSFTYEQSDFDRREFTFVPDDLTYPSYTWLFKGDGSTTEKIPTHTFTYEDRSYEVSLITTSDLGCVCADSSQNIITSWSVGVQDLLGNSAINVYPNPVADYAVIQGNGLLIEHVSVLDVHGKQLLTQKDQLGAKWVIDLTDLSSGVYFLKVETNRGTAIKKVFRQ